MDLYNILNLDNLCTQKDIKNAYKKLALKWHPDRNINNIEQANYKFKEITYAYSILSDIEKRKIYDLNGKMDKFFDNPINLFDLIFKDIDPNIQNLIKKTYYNYDKLKKQNKDKPLIEIIKSIDKDIKNDIFNESFKIINKYFNN